jgi:3-methyladenine DNA glycosylase/8-oxoguanine DNA glycosylase
MPRQPIPTLFSADRALILSHLTERDPKLAVVIAQVGHCNIRMMRGFTLYESLLRSIVYQQLAGKAAAAIFLRVQQLYAKEHDAKISLAASASAGALTGAATGNAMVRIPKKTALLSYPTPEQILATPDTVLRSAGLSGAKTAAMKDLAVKTLDGTVPSLVRARVLSDEELIERLITIRGIGRWTVEMMLMFRLGRLDVLPVSDFGVRKGFQITYKLREMPTPEQMQRRAEKWRPYRSVASWMMWRAVELKQG